MNNYAIDSILNGKRFDERAFDEFREIKIEKGVINKAEGSAMVTIGKTKILAGVKMELGTPYPDTPDEGTIVVNAEFTPLASPDFESGPPSEDATELARVVDRGIRESHALDFKKMCIEEGEKIWMASIDIHIINNDGNLIDASALAAIASLMDAKLPKLTEDGIIDRKEYEKDLKVEHLPIEITVCKINDTLLIDPNVAEEEGVGAKLTVCVREDDMICALQKQGSVGLTMEETKKIIEMVIDKSKEIRKLLKIE